MANNSNILGRPGLGHVGSYQASGIPYLTSSLTVPGSGDTPLQIDFPGVTKFITVTNTLSSGNSLRFGFSEAGVKGTIDNNYIVLAAGDSYTGDLRAKSMYLLSDAATPASASIIAGVTHISVGELKNNWSGSAGVG